MTKEQRHVLRELVDRCVEDSDLVLHNIPVEQVKWLLDAVDEAEQLRAEFRRLRRAAFCLARESAACREKKRDLLVEIGALQEELARRKAGER